MGKKQKGEKTPKQPITQIKESVEEVLTPEVVGSENPNLEPPTEEKPSNEVTIEQMFPQDANNRIDHNHAIELAGLLHKRLTNGSTYTEKELKLLGDQVDITMGIELLAYNVQFLSDANKLGLKVDRTVLDQICGLLSSKLGIELKGLPNLKGDQQGILNFTDALPEEDRKVAEKDAKAIKEAKSKETFAEPDPELSDEQKESVLRQIFSSKNGIGNNLVMGLNWAKKAFKMDNDEPYTVLAKLLSEKKLDTMLLRSIENMIIGKLRNEGSILGAHALLKAWAQTYTDEEVAKIVITLLSHKAENNCKDTTVNMKQRIATEEEIDNSLLCQALPIEIAKDPNRKTAIFNGILSGLNDVSFDLGEGKLPMRIATAAIRKTFVATYGDSENMIKDVLTKVMSLYDIKLHRLSNYVDKSAYATT
jgi:hypothetical protein